MRENSNTKRHDKDERRASTAQTEEKLMDRDEWLRQERERFNMDMDIWLHGKNHEQE